MNYFRFFGKDLKKLKKDMREAIKKYKFNIKMDYDNGSFIIPASKVQYFEHAMCATYHPKKLIHITDVGNLEVQVVSKAHDIKRAITKSVSITPEKLSSTCHPDASNLMIGSYDGTQLSFITVSYAYIDFFLNLLDKKQLTERKYDDIDPEYGLHDYNIKIELRNNKSSFWYELFPDVFTHKEFKNGYAVFTLIDSVSNTRHHKFRGDISYPCESMVVTGASVEAKGNAGPNLIYVDVIMMDEFNDPFLGISRACKLMSVSLLE